MSGRSEEGSGTILNYILCFTLVGIMILGTFLLPQVYNYQTDNRNIGRVSLESRSGLALMADLKLSVNDRTAIVTNMVNEEGLNLFMNLGENQWNDEELVKNVAQEIRWAVECEVLPEEMAEIAFDRWAGNLSADYFTISSAAEYGDLALWKIEYSDNESFEITLLIDAGNYKIYYGEIWGGGIPEAWQRDREREADGAYMSACMQYYEFEYAESVWLDYIFEIEEAGRFGWMTESSARWKTEGRAVTFGFDVFWQQFRGESVFAAYGLKDDTTLIQNQND